MLRPNFNSYILTAFILAVSCAVNPAFSQCLNISEWGGTSAPLGSESSAISNCNYAGEFAHVTDIQAGQTYVITSTTCTDYLTVYDNMDQMVGHGLTPLEFVASASGTYAVHFNMDDNCGTEGACRATAVSCLSCGAIPGCMDPIATNYDPTATFDNCACITPALTNDYCAGAVNLDAYANTNGSCTLTNVSQYSGATSSIAEVAPSLECSDGDQSPADIWFSLTVPTSGVVSFEFIESPGFSSLVECYTGTCGNLTAYAPVLCDNEAERTFTALVPGTVVYFRVWDFGSNDVGNFELCIKNEVTGCTDPTATNYNSAATFDDGNCNFPNGNKPCQASQLVINAACTVADNTTIAMEPGEPLGNCYSGANSTVWFKFIAESAMTNVSTDFPGFTSTDTEVAIYSVVACNDYTGFVEIACDQDGGIIENYNSIITGAPTTVGETYYIQISGWNGTQGTFCIEATSGASNNEICGAIPVACGDVQSGNTLQYSMSNTFLPTNYCGGGPLTAANAFYLLTGTGDDYNISLCNSSFDTRLDVFCLTGGSCATAPELVCVTGNDDDPHCGSVSRSEVSFATIDQAQYYIMVHGYSSSVGDFEIALDCSTPITPPANQDCINNGVSCRPMGEAELLTVDMNCNFSYGSNLGAAQAIATPPCALSTSQSITDVWYQFNSGTYSGFELEILELTGTDVRHALYESCSGTPIFCDQDMFYGLTPDTDYYLQVFTQKGDEGDFELCLKSAEVCAFVIEPTGTDVAINSSLNWSAAFNATGYELMIGTSPGADDFMSLTDIGNTESYQPNDFAYNTTYYITVVPYGANGSINTCPSFSFTTRCPAIESTVDNILDGSCFGVPDGAIDMSVAGGVGPYNYYWTGPNGFENATEDVVQIMGGEYQLIITDSDNGCILIDTFAIEPMEGMTAMTNVVAEACGNDGAIEVLVFGGIEPYTYQWSTGSMQSTTTNIPSGNYEVTVTDADGCTELFDNISVDADGELSASIVNISGVGCGSTNGSISVSPTTGLSPYDYVWSSTTGAVTGSILGVNGSYSINSLPVGTYNVTITDANGCEGSVTELAIEIVEEIELEINEIEHLDCYNNHNGTIKVTAAVGQAPFQFIWSNGVTVPESSGVEALNNLDGGVYSVTVTDVNGCTGIVTDILIEEPHALNLVIHAVESPLCFGENSGSVLIDVEGGIEPFTYNWSNGYSTEDLIGVGAGNYLMTITDGNGCTALTIPATVTNPTAIEINLNGIEHNTCLGENSGSVSIGIFGGDPPYDVIWNNGMTAANLDYLEGGDYQCTITDQSGCQIISPMYTIDEPTESIEFEVTTVTDSPCQDFDLGAIDINVAGGTEPYAYHWSNGETSQDVNGLPSGNYIVTITDGNDCVFISDLIFVDEPDELVVIGTSTPDLNASNNGTATVEIAGGTEPYSYNWDSNTGNQSMATATDLSAGSYHVTVFDVNGCMLVTSVSVEGEISSFVFEESIVKQIALAPNPTNREAQLLLELSTVEEIRIEVFDTNGRQILNPMEYKARQLLAIIDLADEAGGIYLIKVVIGNKEVKTLMLVKK